MPNPLYIYIYIYMICKGSFVVFYGISTLVAYSMPIHVYTYTYINHIWFVKGVWLSFMAFNTCRLFNAKSCSYIYTLRKNNETNHKGL